MTHPRSLKFVDTHVHFWDQLVEGLRYDWLVTGGDAAETAVLGEYGAIRSEKYLPEDFIRETRAVNPAAVVHVQAAVGAPDPHLESEWLGTALGRTPLRWVFIGDGRLKSPAFARTFEEHQHQPGFRGIRDLNLSAHISDRGTAESLKLLDLNEMVLCDSDALARLDETLATVSQYDQLTYCVDHTMMPLQRDPAYFGHWRAALQRVAELPNAVIKISGLGQADHDWTVDSLRPWILACIDVFGTDRAFFGTNWPVDRLYSSYSDVVNAYMTICSAFTEEEQAALLSGNAQRIFNIPTHEEPW